MSVLGEGEDRLATSERTPFPPGEQHVQNIAGVRHTVEDFGKSSA